MTIRFMFENTEFNHNISNWNINPRCIIEYTKNIKNKYKKYNFNLCLYIVKL